MKENSRSMLFGAACLLMMSSVMTACSIDDDASESRSTDQPTAPAVESSPTVGGMLNAEAVTSEYLRAADGLSGSLPPGSSFPAAPAEVSEPDAQFESGFGEIYAAFVWQCEWLLAYRESDDEQSRRESLSRLASWGDLAEVVAHVDEASRQSWRTQIVDPADTGDDDALLSLADACAR